MAAQGSAKDVLAVPPVLSSRNDAFALFPLQPDEATTCEAMLAHPGSRLLISPNHHINSFQVTPARRIRPRDAL